MVAKSLPSPRLLESVLDDFHVKGQIVEVRPGPVVTMYELEPASGIKASRVIQLADDIARNMSALSARVATIPGRSVIGIELPNAPKFEFRYTNEQRTGRKDSTIWGDSDFTGIPAYYGVGASALNPPYSTNRKMVPAYINLSERQQNWLGSVKHSVGNTDLEFEVLYTRTTDSTRPTVPVTCFSQ